MDKSAGTSAIKKSTEVSEIKNSTISDNVVAYGAGGGIAVYQGELAITGSAISDNWIVLAGLGEGMTGGGGIYSETAGLTIADSTISGNEGAFLGGGICNTDGDLILKSSTISGNKATLVGAVYSDYGSTSLENSTFTGNEAAQYGGLALGDGSVTINGCTIAGNIDKHLELWGTGTNSGLYIGLSEISLTNTIISGDTGAELRYAILGHRR